MKSTFVAMAAAIAVFFGLSLPAQEAEAKRLGGGSSFGMKRSATLTPPAVAPKQAATPQQAAPAAAGTGAATAQAAGKRSWLGPVAGLAAGLGLAALASHLGFGEEMASFLLILLLVGAAFFLFRLLTRSRQQPQGQYSYAGAGATGESATARPMRFEANKDEAYKVGADGTAPVASAGNIPADFDTEGFLRQAKLNFIRLQAANDRGDMDDLKSFTTPEVFAEIQMQYEERQRQSQFTDVAHLEANLLEVATENGLYIASVYFHGLIREAEGAEAQPFGEIWHLAKPVSGSFGWRIAGIQQQA
jgi:predicted lipid-binding transport protein (Tim44 family)